MLLAKFLDGVIRNWQMLLNSVKNDGRCQINTCVLNQTNTIFNIDDIAWDSQQNAIINSNGVIRHRKESVFLPDKHCMNSISLRVNHLDVNHGIDKERVAILLGRFLSFDIILKMAIIETQM